MLVMLNELNREWDLLARDHHREVARWAERFPELGAPRGLGDVLAAVPGSPDATLGALLRLGADGETLARRVVLQAMLGAAVRACTGRPQLFGDAVSELWLAIAEYPVQRRPRSVAAGLAWAVRRGVSRQQQFGPLLQVHPDPAGSAEDALAQAVRLGLIDAAMHRTLSLVYVRGLTSAGAAAELGTTADLVRYRCSRTVRHLAAHAELLSATG